VDAQIDMFDEIEWQIAEQCIYGIEKMCRFAPCNIAQEVKCCRECPYNCCAKCEHWRDKK